MSIDVSNVSIDIQKLDQAIVWFTKYIIYMQKNDKVDFYSGYMENVEGYKREIYANARKALDVDSWSENMIGNHYILDHVHNGLNAKSNRGFNNVIDYHGITYLVNKSEEDIEISEDILYRLFRSYDVEAAFSDACEFYGRRYPELSYLLFMRDCGQYLPVKNSDKNHYDRFRKLGIDTDCLLVCSWDNYQKFISIHERVRQRLEQVYDTAISLLDAHSFIWTLYDAPEDLVFRDDKAIQKKPKGQEYLNDVTEKIDYAEKAVKRAQRIEDELDHLGLLGEEREAIIKVRVNQGVFRDRLLKRYQKCCLCNVHNPGLLIASHIRPWSECIPEERLDVNNGLLLCPNHDKLFDKGWITISNEGSIVISKRLEEVDRICTNIKPGMRLMIREGNKKYLEYHREHIFKK